MGKIKKFLGAGACIGLVLIQFGCTPGTRHMAPIEPPRTPKVEAVDFTEALKALKMTQWIYDANPVVGEPEGSTYKLNMVWVSPDDPAYGRIMVLLELTTGTQYVVFRGTKEPSDIVRDIIAIPTPSGPLGMLIHTGFLDAAGAAHPLVLEHLNPNARVVLVGHSMGGAVASIVGLYLVAQDGWSPDRLRIITFGQPYFAVCECGDIRLNHLRFVHSKDPVPMVPQGSPPGPYHHSGPAVFLWRAQSNAGARQWSFVPMEGEAWSQYQLERMPQTDIKLHLTDSYLSWFEPTSPPRERVDYSTARWEQD